MLFLIPFEYTISRQVNEDSASTRGVINYNSLYKQNVILISDGIAGEWKIEKKYIYYFYFNLTKDKKFKEAKWPIHIVAKTPFWDLNKQKIVDLKDDGANFDNIKNDSIYGSFITGDIIDFDTRDMEFDICCFDTLGLKIRTYRLPITYFPSIPKINYPSNNSILKSNTINLQFFCDTSAEMHGAMLFEKKPKLGELPDRAIWKKSYNKLSNPLINEKISLNLFPKNEYCFIIWSGSEVKVQDNKLQSGGSSMEWTLFFVDTSSDNKNTFNLYQNFPNPFSSTSSFSWTQETGRYTKINLFNVLGEKILTICDKVVFEYYNYYLWDGTNSNKKPVPSGIYFLNAEIDGIQKTVKIVLVK